MPKVLLVEDDEALARGLEFNLKREGFEVVRTRRGDTALGVLVRTRPDIVTLDVVLPGMDGLETLRRLKQRAPDVPVVMLSGHGQARNIVEAMRLGASDFLRKPFEVSDLSRAMAKALAEAQTANADNVVRLRDRRNSAERQRPAEASPREQPERGADHGDDGPGDIPA